MASMPNQFPPNAQPQPPGESTSEAGTKPKAEVPASGNKAKKNRVFCHYCHKANHSSDVCRNKPGNITIIAGGSAAFPPGTTLQLGGATKVTKKKKKKSKNKNKDGAAAGAMELN